MSNVIETIARKIDALITCQEKDNVEWISRHLKSIQYIEKEVLPSGSGIDSGMEIDLGWSTGERIVIDIPFHHMDECGGYCGWVYYRAVVTPSLQRGFNLDLSVTSDSSDTEEYDRESTMEYLADILHDTLSQEYEDKGEI